MEDLIVFYKGDISPPQGQSVNVDTIVTRFNPLFLKYLDIEKIPGKITSINGYQILNKPYPGENNVIHWVNRNLTILGFNDVYKKQVSEEILSGCEHNMWRNARLIINGCIKTLFEYDMYRNNKKEIQCLCMSS